MSEQCTAGPTVPYDGRPACRLLSTDHGEGEAGSTKYAAVIRRRLQAAQGNLISSQPGPVSDRLPIAQCMAMVCMNVVVVVTD